jgi:hypothetical protein
MEDDRMTDFERAILAECLDQNETIPTTKTDSVFDRALSMKAEDFAQYFEARVNSPSAFKTVLNIPKA